MLRELAGKPAALVTFLEGVWIRRPQARHCWAVGQAMARLHLAGQSFKLARANALGLAGWRPLYASFRSRADEVAPGLSAIIEQELDHLEAQLAGRPAAGRSSTPISFPTTSSSSATLCPG